MNLAIVLAVSQYTSLSPLPGCRNDARAMAALLKTESKFDDVLVILDETPAASVKGRIIEFVSRHKTTPVNEIVVYFSGHGEFVGNEFYYLLSDYDPKRRKQTTLENAEIDNLLRTLSPQLAVKIVDACASGVTYIKDPDSFEAYLKGTQSSFKSCYFMFSSHSNQSSLADEDLSFFTRSLLTAVLNHQTPGLRYKDLIDFISDDFDGNSVQRPFFVVQADFTEQFCTVSETLRAAIREAAGLASTTPAIEPPTKSPDLIAKVRDDARVYCTEEQAIDALTGFAKRLRRLNPPPDAAQLYTVTIEEQTDFALIPTTAPVGTWLSKNPHSLFAMPLHEEIRRPSAMFEQFKVGPEFLIKEVIRGFKSTVDLPFAFVMLTAKPHYENLQVAGCFVAPLISKTHLRTFWTYVSFRDVGWKERVVDGEVQWSTTETLLKEEHLLLAHADEILEGFWKSVLDQIRSRFGFATVPSPDPAAQA